MARWYAKYNIGEEIGWKDLNCPCIMPGGRFEPKSYSIPCGEAIKSLKVGDGAFLDIQNNFKWTYGIVISRGRMRTIDSDRTEEYIKFQTSADGSKTEYVFKNSYHARIRPLKKDHGSFHPLGTVLASPFSAPYYYERGYNNRIISSTTSPDTIMENNNDCVTCNPDTHIQSITAIPIYANKSFEELRLEDYLAGNKGMIDTTLEYKYNHGLALQRQRQRRSRKQSLAITNSEFVEKWLEYPLRDYPRSADMVDVDLRTRRIQLRLPIPGAFYTKSECLVIIKSTTVKGSGERRELIRFLVKYEFVPSEKELYSLLSMYENLDIDMTSPNELFEVGSKDNNWGMTSDENLKQGMEWGNRFEDIGFKCYLPDFVRKRTDLKVIGYSDGSSKKGWRGQLRFYLIPICFDDDTILQKEGLSYFDSGDSRLVCLDICSFIGSQRFQECQSSGGRSFKEKKRRLRSLYFPPSLFPPPVDINSGGDNHSFCRLKSYIELVSEREGSPVICIRGDKANHSKVFACRQNKRGGTECPFGFQVRWDKHGYFVHLLISSNWSQTCGCPWHCCRQ